MANSGMFCNMHILNYINNNNKATILRHKQCILRLNYDYLFSQKFEPFIY